jgi:hypothetical protein
MLVARIPQQDRAPLSDVGTSVAGRELKLSLVSALSWLPRRGARRLFALVSILGFGLTLLLIALPAETARATVRPGALVKPGSASWLVGTKLQHRLGEQEWDLRTGRN